MLVDCCWNRRNDFLKLTRRSNEQNKENVVHSQSNCASNITETYYEILKSSQEYLDTIITFLYVFL